MDEIWKDIPGFDGYKISNTGKVMSCRYGSRAGLILKPNKYREITPSFTACKTHYVIDLIDGEGARRLYSIARLLYAVFIGPIPDGVFVDHIDRNGLNNDLSNLRLATQSQNIMNQNIRKGRKYKGTRFTRDGKWEARTTYKKKVVYLGRYETEIEAAAVYNDWAAKTYGAFAVLNKLEVLN